MANTGHFRGMLLEEAALYLLERCGYRIVGDHQHDSTLARGSSGLEVKGRGAQHQIDAIAEFGFSAPLTHPQRLLVEAKCWRDPVGVNVIRNAVGVVKDTGEYWHGSRRTFSRYHYLFSVFSVSGFTEPAQNYAFAQDIFLFPLDNSTYMEPIVRELWGVKGSNFGKPSGQDIEIEVGEVRRAVRRSLRRDEELVGNGWNLTSLGAAIRQVGGAVIGMAGGFFPLFLVPQDPRLLHEFPSELRVRLRYDDRSWYIDYEGQRLFSFQLPNQLLHLYATGGQLRAADALRLKRQFFARIDAIWADRAGSPRFFRFRLDLDWLGQVQEQLQDR